MIVLGGCAVSHAARPGRNGCEESLADLFDRVSSMVVSINATLIHPTRLSERVTRVAGSGFIIDAAGLVLTNSHVVFGSQSISVTTDDGTRLPGTLVGADPILDVAVVRIARPADGALPVATFGDSDRVRVGEEVLAIGNPLGLDQTLTRGIVSAVNRILPETVFSPLEPMIQTDASINPGNSGGPLLNRCGEVVGITTVAVSEAQNIAFAIPINLARALLPSLVAHGRVLRPWIGFHGQIVGAGLRDLLKLPLTDGLLVEVVEPGSPAEAAGLRGGRLEVVVDGQPVLLGGDIITRLNGIRVDALEVLGRAVRDLKIGAQVRLEVFREGTLSSITYRLPERPLLPSDFVADRSTLPLRRWPDFVPPRPGTP